MPIPLESPRLILRRFRDSDLETFLAYRNEPEVAKYQGWDIPYPREKVIEFIVEMKDKVPGQQGEWMQLAVERKDTHEFIGDVAFFIKRDDARQAYVGFTIASAHWRNGFATEAVVCLLKYLFDELNLHRVTADCDVENNASWRTLEKLGFRREAHFVENIFFKGAYASEYHYGMLAREWIEHNGKR